jgi:putative phosphoesterase
VRIALISDTHLPSLMRQLDELGPQVANVLASADLILHAGDVTSSSVLDWCEQFAPVRVAFGNNDLFRDDRMTEVQLLDVDGWRIGMTHDLRPESRPVADILAANFGGRDLDIVISGDTHVDRLEHRDGVLVVNSGSPILPHHLSTRLGTMATLEFSDGSLRAEIVVLGATPGARNPGTARTMILQSPGGR